MSTLQHFACFRKEPKYISVLLILLVSALLLSNPFYIVLKAVHLSEAHSAIYSENMVITYAVHCICTELAPAPLQPLLHCP